MSLLYVYIVSYPHEGYGNWNDYSTQYGSNSLHKGIHKSDTYSFDCSLLHSLERNQWETGFVESPFCIALLSHC